MGKGEQGNNVMEVMTMNVITKTSHSFHGDTPWMAKDATKTGYNCNEGRSERTMRHKLKHFYETLFGLIKNKIEIG